MGEKKPMKRSNLLLLLTTLLFLAAVGVLFWQENHRSGQSAYTIFTETQALPEESAARTAQGTVNLNTAEIEELMQLPGIGETLARRIVDDRRENGPYTSLGELLRVRGVGESLLEEIGGYVTLETEGDR